MQLTTRNGGKYGSNTKKLLNIVAIDKYVNIKYGIAAPWNENDTFNGLVSFAIVFMKIYDVALVTLV
jgi:hypothetical protein